MIKYIKRKDLDTTKYNACIENALNTRVYAFSWYLDIVADNWDVLVYGDYEAVMPVPWRQKFFIKYVYQPFWLLQIGIYYTDTKISLDLFLKYLKKRFLFAELRMNTGNTFSIYQEFRSRSTMQVISLEESYESIYHNYNRNRKRDLKKAILAELVEKWGDDPVKLVDLFRENVGQRTTDIKEVDYDKLLRVMQVSIEKSVGEILCVYDANNNLVASSFFLNYQERATEVVCSTDFSNRNNGANTFFNDRAIFRYHQNYKIFDFGGSTMKNIAKYYRSFGARDEYYDKLKISKLPSLFKR